VLHATRLVSIAGHLANFAALWPAWREEVGTPHATPPPPWPSDDSDDHRPAATREGLACLVTDPAADVWLPTVAEALDAPRRAQQAGDSAAAAELAMSPEEIDARNLAARRLALIGC